LPGELGFYIVSVFNGGFVNDVEGMDVLLRITGTVVGGRFDNIDVNMNSETFTMAPFEHQSKFCSS